MMTAWPPILSWSVVKMEPEALKVGDEAPEISLPTAAHGNVSLKGLRGRKVLVAFYPRDDTPG